MSIRPVPGGNEMKAKIHVTLKQGVLDPQGKAVENALSALGFGGVSGVRQGKYIELELEMVDDGQVTDAKKADHHALEIASTTVGGRSARPPRKRLQYDGPTVSMRVPGDREVPSYHMFDSYSVSCYTSQSALSQRRAL